MHAFLDGVWLLWAARDETGTLTDFTVLDLSPRAAEMAGIPRESLLGELLGRAIPTTRRLGHIEVYARASRPACPRSWSSATTRRAGRRSGARSRSRP